MLKVNALLQLGPHSFAHGISLVHLPRFVSLAIFVPQNYAIIMSFVHEARSALHSFTTDVRKELGAIEGRIEDEIHSHTHLDSACYSLHAHTHGNRYHSFAPPRTGNDAKWFVDGCGYFWAVSVALEEARESIWILDWWLSPGTYELSPMKARSADLKQSCI
jgi:hypothetical protein